MWLADFLEEVVERSGHGADLLEKPCTLWATRGIATAALLAGLSGAAYYEAIDTRECPRAREVASFWGSLVQLTGSWLAFDALACAFFLHCSWSLTCIGRLARLAGFALSCIAIYGAVEYCRMIPYSHCWNVGSAVVLAILVAFPMLAGFWWAIYDDCGCPCCHPCREVTACSSLCMNACCARHVWNLTDDENDEELGILKRSSGVRGKFSFRQGARAPASIGKQQLRTRRSWRKIRVVRGDEVLFVGHTRASVRRWVRQHLQDYEGVFIEDVHGASREAKSAWRNEKRRGHGHGRWALAKLAAWAPMDKIKPRQLGRDSRKHEESNS
mmetsp:Transcript_27834/g.54745  ORF Transcript_27834/g.54745 Transcript_27834/m.54745 type:complete len:328 (+) Transcript_27834:93-1076(+)|eukprot:CAMPEP_0172878028 /NCGR_PEP_ID=MMETSP1075-20121228/108532_1 /TAXON_ID=2916 /ORGANISM="Ceratium fusus, Strain PA161109" /LENGTH=327 /DNA_ID=CAMNT_0013729719 /DNA_START=46 /DNA_END=1029 /DNA_ORIENTATION=+